MLWGNRPRGRKNSLSNLAAARKDEASAARGRHEGWSEWRLLPRKARLFGKFLDVYQNEAYTVVVNEVDTGHPYFGIVTHLACIRRDGQAVHSWLDLQHIKNTLIGEESTAIEVYPPQSRVVDELNMYHLWIVRGEGKFPLDLKDLM